MVYLSGERTTAENAERWVQVYVCLYDGTYTARPTRVELLFDRTGTKLIGVPMRTDELYVWVDGWLPSEVLTQSEHVNEWGTAERWCRLHIPVRFFPIKLHPVTYINCLESRERRAAEQRATHTMAYLREKVHTEIAELEERILQAKLELLRSMTSVASQSP
jgi:hypothetical protein